MKKRTIAACRGLVASLVAATMPIASSAQSPPAKYQFGIRNTEDLVLLPNLDWVITSGMLAPGSKGTGHLYAVNKATGTATSIYPSETADKPDGMFGTTCTPPTPATFSAHGIALRPVNGPYELYVINDGRDAIELFTLELSQGKPIATWHSCIPMPLHATPNDVVALPDGGLAVTVFADPSDPQTLEKLEHGKDTGYILEWHQGVGFSKVPGSDMSGANGLEVDPDGRYFFVGAWSTSQLIRLSRGRTPVERVAVSTGTLTDNITWSWDGQLIVTGQTTSVKALFDCYGSKTAICELPFTVVSINPLTLERKVLIDEPHPRGFGGGTVARVIGDEIWVGTFRGDRIARYPRKF